jgi:hypothetical protein
VATPISDTPIAAPSDTVVERLDALEADNQRLRRMTTALFLAAGLLVGLCVALVVVAARRGLPGSIASVVESESFIVKDTDGNVRGAWGVADDGAMRLVLQDAAGRAALNLTLLSDGSPGITFTDSAGQSRLVLGLLPDQTTTLVFADQNGRTRTVLGLAPDGSSSLAFADRDGDTRAGLGLDQRGIGTFTLQERPTFEAPPEAAPADTTGDGAATQ